MKFFALFVLSLFILPEAYGQTSLRSPNVSANALFLARQSNFSDDAGGITERNGIDLQEAELAFYADVDPYHRLTMLLTVHPEYERDATTGTVSQKWQVEPEELYAESSDIPSLTLRVGKFKAAFGKHNLLHDHAFPFVEAPLVNQALLGEEGLNDIGLSAAAFLPFSWYSEFTLQFLRGEGENAEFNSPTAGDGVGLAHWKNLVDLSEAWTAELGASYAQGNNSFFMSTKIGGADLTFKWRPTEGGKYASFIFAAEYIERHLDQGTGVEKGRGGDLWTQYQFAERWMAGLRYDQLEVEGSDPGVNPASLENLTSRKFAANLTFLPSEFSSYRFELSQTQGPSSSSGDTTENKVYVQANFTIGAHPAHSY